MLGAPPGVAAGGGRGPVGAAAAPPLVVGASPWGWEGAPSQQTAQQQQPVQQLQDPQALSSQSPRWHQGDRGATGWSSSEVGTAAPPGAVVSRSSPAAGSSVGSVAAAVAEERLVASGSDVDHLLAMLMGGA